MLCDHCLDDNHLTRRRPKATLLLSPEVTINSQVYCKRQQKLSHVIQVKRSELDGMYLLRNNARLRTSTDYNLLSSIDHFLDAKGRDRAQLETDHRQFFNRNTRSSTATISIPCRNNEGQSPTKVGDTYE